MYIRIDSSPIIQICDCQVLKIGSVTPLMKFHRKMQPTAPTVSKPKAAPRLTRGDISRVSPPSAPHISPAVRFIAPRMITNDQNPVISRLAKVNTMMIARHTSMTMMRPWRSARGPPIIAEPPESSTANSRNTVKFSRLKCSVGIHSGSSGANWNS